MKNPRSKLFAVNFNSIDLFFFSSSSTSSSLNSHRQTSPLSLNQLHEALHVHRVSSISPLWLLIYISSSSMNQLHLPAANDPPLLLHPPPSGSSALSTFI
ncbi:hypothetical protein F2Q68_00026702 [Brassica cretica]|uniref:Uncharacterized protein n=2 Tax=Brassica cretica TaxID=69181 RepID=A0A8S9IGM6_BRACR|nr:hypothetical protein F2Q68_00026702 [Brassica cretica]KAF3580156.1 hypothetical protein DY000_02033270 [Brassica cretica]